MSPVGEDVTRGSAPAQSRTRRIHPAWFVAATALVALIGAAGFRAAPGVLMVPLEEEFGWSLTEMSVAVTVNLLLFGLTAPFAAALMQRFGIRAVTAAALMLIAAGSALSVFVTAPLMLVLTWGLLIGLGTGSMALVFAATVTDTWFVKRRGRVSGVLTAGWRIASLIIASGALLVVPLVLALLRDRPEDLGVRRYGEPEPATPPAAETTADADTPAAASAAASATSAATITDHEPRAEEPTGARPPSAAQLAIRALRDAMKVRAFGSTPSITWMP